MFDFPPRIENLAAEYVSQKMDTIWVSRVEYSDVRPKENIVEWQTLDERVRGTYSYSGLSLNHSNDNDNNNNNNKNVK